MSKEPSFKRQPMTIYNGKWMTAEEALIAAQSIAVPAKPAFVSAETGDDGDDLSGAETGDDGDEVRRGRGRPRKVEA